MRPTTTPRAIGRYRVVASLHTGEQTREFQCHDAGIRSMVTVKVAHEDAPDPGLPRRRLRREARLRAELEGANVCRCTACSRRGADRR